ncbi:DUF3159 domain-containing protein [Actinomyces vulturis]|uniref:DUF3159 domain-containing protein n=1 Tax=Actinomyces vulturis TaxID=1857645 RepID=UPI00082D1989|nr:DUF3159 domain-containing protein [Actinomyces vulturis]
MSESGLKVLQSQEFDLYRAVGGYRGVIESAGPVTLFLTIYVITSNLLWAGASALIIAGLAIATRLIQRQSITPALGGVVVTALSVLATWKTGKAENFYILGLGINAVCLIGLVTSILARCPLVGVVDALMRGHDMSWRTDPDRATHRKVYRQATWVFAAMFALRLIVETPMYIAQASTVLGITRLIMGLPLFALTLWLMWMMVRTLPAASATTTQE